MIYGGTKIYNSKWADFSIFINEEIKLCSFLSERN